MVFEVIDSYGRNEYAMSEDKVIRLKSPGTPGGGQDALTEVLREGACRLLASAIEAEVAAFLERFQTEKTDEGVSRMSGGPGFLDRIFPSLSGFLWFRLPAG
jgi:hypothetical protein